jgi:hypothetical protein
MATVSINDLTIEPKTPAPRATSPAEQQAATPKSGPELEREIEALRCRMHERALRTWAY